MRIMDLADELGTSTVAITALCGRLGIDALWAGAEIGESDAQRVREASRGPTPATSPDPRPMGIPPGSIAGFGGNPVAPLPTPAPLSPAPPLTPVLSPAAADTASAAAQRRPATGPTLIRRTDRAVTEGWIRWWRAVGLEIGTLFVVVLVALLFSAELAISQTYRYGETTLSNAKLSLLLAVYLAGTAWATLTVVRGAATALDAWNRIADSPRALRGRLSIVWLVLSAVLACAWLVLQLGVGILELSR